MKCITNLAFIQMDSDQYDYDCSESIETYDTQVETQPISTSSKFQHSGDMDESVRETEDYRKRIDVMVDNTAKINLVTQQKGKSSDSGKYERPVTPPNRMMDVSKINVRIHTKEGKKAAEFVDLFIEEDSKWFSFAKSWEDVRQGIKAMNRTLTENRLCKIRMFDGYREYVADGKVQFQAPNSIYTFIEIEANGLDRKKIYLVNPEGM